MTELIFDSKTAASTAFSPLLPLPLLHLIIIDNFKEVGQFTDSKSVSNISVVSVLI